ncbi:hypothetical protein KFL_001010110 [Klebsormidium nitens]|uniref:Uncharacterized protein n=1 Tax=Klebsormidium nitens TaxID=105231 RepID=A0A1Y1I026_KLENI|nr:hypothetical protein KFL_001010110 [Klebsormidium nitens]|eukprot:GAQ82126.1 hypothetical protein KFL_001010110 [Klebsormidium nitens]
MPPSDGPPLVPSLNLHSSSLRKSSLSSGSSSERRRTSTFRVRYSEDNSNAIPPASSSSEDGDSPPQSARRQSLSLGQLRSSAEGVLLNSNAGSRLNSSEAPHSLRSSLEASRQALRDSAQSAGNETAPERLARITQESSRHSTPLAGPNEVKEEKKVEAEGESSDSDLIEERRNSQYFATVAKVAFNSEEHNIPSLGIGPSVDFFKLMAPSPDAKWKAHPDAATGRGEDPNVGRLQLLIPPTVIYSAYEVMGFFTSEDGYVTRKDDLHRSDIFQMLLPSYSEGRATPVSLTAVNLPVAVQKSRKGRWRTEAQLVLMNELNAYLDSSKLSGNCALQQYVKCAGPKVSLVRCVWRSGGLRPSQVFIIGSRRRKGTRPPNDLPTRAQSAGMDLDVVVKALRHAVIVQGYLNTVEFPRACTVQPVSGHGWAEPLALTARIARHVERARKLPGRFQELVADFIHGEDGRWWFLQVKAFKIAPFEATVLKPLRAQTERRAQECRGDYCRTLGMDDSIDAMNEDGRGADRRRPKGFDSLSREEKRKYYLDQLNAANRDRPVSGRPGARDRAGPGKVSRALRMILHKSIILDRTEMQKEGNKSGPHEDKQEDMPSPSGGSTARSNKTPRRFSDFLRELEQRREQAKAERQALYKGNAEEDDLEPDPLPKPQRTVPILQHDKLPAFYYELVPVCSDCFRVYLAKDHQRALKEDAARHASPLKDKKRKGTRDAPDTARF